MNTQSHDHADATQQASMHPETVPHPDLPEVAPRPGTTVHPGAQPEMPSTTPAPEMPATQPARPEFPTTNPAMPEVERPSVSGMPPVPGGDAISEDAVASAAAGPAA